MDFDQPDDEPPRPVTPRLNWLDINPQVRVDPWVELSRFAEEDWVKIFVYEEPVILDENQDFFSGWQHISDLESWSKRWIVYDTTPGEYEDSPICVRWTFVWRIGVVEVLKCSLKAGLL